MVYPKYTIQGIKSNSKIEFHSEDIGNGRHSQWEQEKNLKMGFEAFIFIIVLGFILPVFVSVCLRKGLTL